MKLENPSKGELFVVEWQYRMLGGFFTGLAEIISRADAVNTEKLRKGFPDEVDAVKNYLNTPGWWEQLQEKAGFIEP